MALDEGLPSGLGDMLRREGYQVVSPYRGQNVDAIIVTGIDNNLMNMQDIKDTAPVIDASGKTPEDIIKRLRELRFG
ncbi:MAG: YkuS family protein [Desulfocucumaceae bacterium]